MTDEQRISASTAASLARLDVLLGRVQDAVGAVRIEIGRATTPDPKPEDGRDARPAR